MTYEDLRILQLNLSDLYDTLTRVYKEVDECKSSGKNPASEFAFSWSYKPTTPEFKAIRVDLRELKDRVERHKLLIDQIIDLIKDERAKVAKSIQSNQNFKSERSCHEE